MHGTFVSIGVTKGRGFVSTPDSVVQQEWLRKRDRGR